MSQVIGISIGNTSSSIAVANNEGKVDVIANQDGEHAIPTALAYVGEDEYHGGQAIAHLIRNPQNTIINFRDYIGQTFDKVDPLVTERAAHAKDINGSEIGFEIVKGEEGATTITAEDATVRHLIKLKEAAEDFTGSKVEGSVIAVPTNFTESQKDAILKASEKAGLKVHQLINEPSAALLAHATLSAQGLTDDKTYAVVDFGGIRSDAAVISVRGGIMTILATSHDYELNGDKLDAALSEFIAKEFQKKYNTNPRNNARSLAKLKEAVILTRKTLSNVQSSPISIESLADGYDFHSTINRLRFEVVARNVLNQFTGFVEDLLKKANLDVLDIDEVLLVGGVSNTPKIASNLEALFPESTTITKVSNPELLIARGAALQAALIESFDEEEIKESLQPIVLNTQHLSKAIGIVDAEGAFVPILKAETTYPIRRSIQIDAPNGDVLVTVVEGEHHIKETVLEPPAKTADEEDDEDDYSDEEPEVVREKHYAPSTKLAQLAVRGVKAGKVEVTVNISKDGVLTVSARELAQGSVPVKGEIKA